MKNTWRLLVTLVAVLMCTGFFLARGDSVSASTTDKIRCGVTRTFNGYEFYDFPEQIVYGQDNPVGNLYHNGEYVPRDQYKIYYHAVGSMYAYESYIPIQQVGVIEYTVDISGMGVVTGTVEILKGDINSMIIKVQDTCVLEKNSGQPYVQIGKNGYFIEIPSLSYTYGNSSNPDNSLPGTGYITINTKGCPILSGTRTVTYNIKKAEPGDYVLMGELKSSVYTGSPIKYSSLYLYSRKSGDNCQLRNDEIHYSNNINVGTATVTISGDRFNGKITKDFQIQAYDINSKVTYQKRTYTYTGSRIDPGLSSIALDFYGEKIYLVRDVDFEICSYSNDVNAGTEKVWIRGIGNYCGDEDLEFTIEPRSLKDAKVTIPDVNELDSDDTLLNRVEVIVNGKTLRRNTDYNISCSASEITITGINNYKDTLKKSYSRKPIDLSQVTVKYEDIDDWAYWKFNYEKKEPKISLWAKDIKGKSCEVIAEPGQIEVRYSDNINAGEGKITITSKSSRFTNSKVVTFNIKPIYITELVFIAPSSFEGKDTFPLVFYDHHQLEVNKDFDIKLDNYGPGKVKAELEFKGNFYGTKTMEYEIHGNISDAKVSSVIMDKSSVKLSFEHNGYELVEGRDYKMTMCAPYDKTRSKFDIVLIGLGEYEDRGSILLDMTEFFDEFGLYDELVIPDQYYKCEKPEPYFDKDGKTTTIYNLMDEQKQELGKYEYGSGSHPVYQLYI